MSQGVIFVTFNSNLQKHVSFKVTVFVWMLTEVNTLFFLFQPATCFCTRNLAAWNLLIWNTFSFLFFKFEIEQIFMLPHFLQVNWRHTGQLGFYTWWSGWLGLVLTVYRFLFLFVCLTTCKVFQKVFFIHFGQYEILSFCPTEIW